MYLNKSCYLLCPLIAMAYATSVFAGTQSMPVTLSADNIIYHNKTHTSEYHKHVKVNYGNSEFSGDQMIVKHPPHQPPTELTITGKPVAFNLHRKPNQAQIQGHAQSITLLPKKNLAILEGNAHIINGIEILQSNTIIYHLDQTKKIINKSEDLSSSPHP
jgi:lipopolysaccharide transport protein LptA